MKIKKSLLLLLLIVVLAAVLRFLAASHLDVNPDEMIYTSIPLNIISAGRLSTVEQAPLFFYLTDLGYQTFGFNVVTARLPAIIFSLLSVMMVFLITQLLFADIKKSLVSSLLLAVSGYAIIYNLEMDIMAFFFILLSLYFYVLFVIKDKETASLFSYGYYLYLSALALALGILSKPFVALIIPVYVAFYLLYVCRKTEKKLFFQRENTWVLHKKMIWALLISIGIMVIVVSPVLIYNYLLYQNQGITDFYFTTSLGIGKNIYAGLGGQKPWAFQTLHNVTTDILSAFARYDLVLFVLGLLGLGHLMLRKNPWAYLCASFMIFYTIYIGGKTGSSTHYVILVMMLALFSGHAFFLILEKVHLIERKKIWFSIILAVAIINVIITGSEIKSTSSIVLLQQFSAEVPANAIVITDPLIYRGIYSWSFGNHHYLEGTYFSRMMEQLQNIPGEKITVPLYYIECGRNSFCGWKQEDYLRIFNFSESLGNYFKNELELQATIQGSDVLTFTVYKGSMAITPALYEAIDRTHQFYFYPVGWKYTENVVDNYSLDTTFESLLQKTGFMILFINIGLVLISIGSVFYFLWKHHE